MIGAIVAVMLALGLAIYFFATRSPRPPVTTAPVAPLIDPVLSARVKADTEATNQAYAKFKAQYTPEQIKKIQQQLLEQAQRLQVEQNKQPTQKTKTP